MPRDKVSSVHKTRFYRRRWHRDIMALRRFSIFHLPLGLIEILRESLKTRIKRERERESLTERSSIPSEYLASPRSPPPSLPSITTPDVTSEIFF